MGGVSWLQCQPFGSFLPHPICRLGGHCGVRKPFPGAVRHFIVDARIDAADLAALPAGHDAGQLPLLFLLGILCGAGIATFSVDSPGFLLVSQGSIGSGG